MRTYKYPIRNHPKNKRLGNLLDELANVYNHFLRLEKRYYRMSGRYAGRLRLQPHLTKLLKRTKKHWAWIPRDTLDAVIIRIDQGYHRFLMTGKKAATLSVRPNSKVNGVIVLRDSEQATNSKRGASVSLSSRGT